MMKRQMLTAMGLVLGLGSIGMADDTQARLAAMEAQIKAQQAEIQTLRSSQGDTWLNEQRTAEVKALVQDVLADADTRASLAEGGSTAGHKNGHFFLASEDGNFLLNIWGMEQFRYVYEHTNGNHLPGEETPDAHHSGFHNARTEVGFNGHIYDPKITYAVDILFSDSEDNGLSGESGEAFLQNAWIAYDMCDHSNIKAGQFKTPFLREDIIGDGNQLAADRSLLSNNFGAGYTQGIQVTWNADMWRAWAAVHDGVNQANTSFASDINDIAVTGRVEVLLAGKWNEFDDFVAWSGSSNMGILLGAAIEYDNVKNDGSGGGTAADQLRWTADVTAKFPELMGLSLYAAVIGSSAQNNEPGQSHGDQYGILAQASFFAIPDKMDIFGRWEYTDLDDHAANSVSTISTVHDTCNLVTVGTNYYFHKHDLKATLDFTWVIDRAEGLGNDQTGVLGSSNRNEFVVRSQIQFQF